MARPSKAVEPESISGPSVIDLNDQQQIEDFEGIIAQLPSDQKAVALYRIADLGRPRFLCSLLPTEFSLDTIQERYGGGKYRVEYLNPQTNTKLRQAFEIEGEPILQRQIKRENSLSQSQPSSEFSLAEELRKLREELNEVKRGGFQERLLELVLTKNQAPAPPSLQERLMELKLMREAFGPTPGSVGTNEIFTAMKSGMDLVADGLGGRGSDSTSKWLSIVDKYAPMVMGMLTKVVLPQQPMYNGTAPNPAQPEIMAPQNGQTSPSKFSEIAPNLKAIAPLFIAAASMNRHPASCIESVYPLIPAQHIPAILDWLNSPNWFADLCTVDERIALQAAWWQEAFYPNMIFALQNDGELPEDENETREDLGEE